jgi:RNA polymerase sigma factor (sigma-70 family)
MKGGWRVNDFNKIYETYGNQVYKYLVSLTRDASLAEELTQETFYQAVKSIHKFREDCKLSVWLCQIAKYSYYKHKKKHKNHEDYDITQENMIDSESPEYIYEKKDSKLSILKAIHMLEEPYKEVISLRTYSELSFKEIGEIFQKTENWARITFYRGKTKLKDILVK